tara:strand:+ start:2084 stop:2587 length:504 start_codon:yes stop_codon:yes gene_type:complete
MEIFKVDGRQIHLGRSWTDAAGTQHPKSWGRWSADEKAAAGISSVVLQPLPDQRLYTSSHNPDGSVASTARALNDVGEGMARVPGVKSSLIAQVKQQQGALLAQTDWQIIRKADAGTAIDAKVQSWRNAIRAKADELEAAVTAAADTDALAVLLDAGTLRDWPELDE